VSTTIASYTVLASRLAAVTKSTAAKPTVANDVRIYLERVTKIRSVDEFLNDDRVYRFAMKAFGLGDMIYAKAFMRKVLSEGVDSKAAFANKLADTRYAEFASTFNFKRYNDATTVFDRTRQGTVDRYIRQTIEEDAGAGNDNVRLALYFERKAPAITSPYQILADKALLNVVYTALGLPVATSVMDIDAQADLIRERVNFDDFKAPDKLNKFIGRFAALADAKIPTPVSGAASLLAGGPGGGGPTMSADLLLSLQSIRHGFR